VYTLPAKTNIRIRQPGRHLLAWFSPILGGLSVGRISFELTDWVERPSMRTSFYWFDFGNGEFTRVYYETRPFELEIGDALVGYSGDATVYLLGFTDDHEVRQAIDVARDGVLEGREAAATRILRDALPHGWPLCLALLRRERNLLASGGANRP
jgi:hypothetical protein